MGRMGCVHILPVNAAFDSDVDVMGSPGVNKALLIVPFTVPVADPDQFPCSLNRPCRTLLVL